MHYMAYVCTILPSIHPSTRVQILYVVRCCTCTYDPSLFVPPPRVPVTVFFTAQNEREYNFNVQCSVKRKLTPITLNVKAEVYAINVSMECEAVDGSMVKLNQGKSAVRRVDMGTVSEGIVAVPPDVSLMYVFTVCS